MIRSCSEDDLNDLRRGPGGGARLALQDGPGERLMRKKRSWRLWDLQEDLTPQGEQVYRSSVLKTGKNGVH